ncbi:YbbR-like domain-containing protein [Clostridium ganghwense]|uniref:CdaR family protein n=1 Tax=Clostridium ganghwense TaxID=312089 RepID=A0ABT4CR15_9CLOT|nr:CdaR family protein [Clostridium ganghwense]MCY6371505.1 CdaR family protein [Clostridium ganghwense]
MVRKSRQQLIIKICCVIASFVLWLYTSNDEATSKTYKVTNIPIEVVNEEALIQTGFILSPNQNFTTSLRITGTPADVYSVRPEEFKIVADIGAYALKKGSNRIPINILKRPNRNINIVNDGAMWITVNVDDYVEKSFPIKAQINGESKNGFYKETPIITPSTVVVSGAKQYVEKVEKVLVEIKMNNPDKNVSLLAPLKVVDKTGREVSEVQLSPKFADVIVPIQKTKQVGINIKTKGELNKDLILKSIKPKLDKVIITGEPKDLVKIEKLDTEPIDLSILTSEKTDLKLKLVLPVGIKLVKGEEYINTQIILDKIVQKNININVKVKNLPEGVSVNLEKDSVSLVVSGGRDIVNNLTSSDIRCLVNLESLEEGEYTIPISIELPPGVTKISQNIEFVKVNIVKNKETVKGKDKEDNSQKKSITNSTTVNN